MSETDVSYLKSFAKLRSYEVSPAPYLAARIRNTQNTFLNASPPVVLHSLICYFLAFNSI